MHLLSLTVLLLSCVGHLIQINRFFRQSWQVSVFILTNTIILYLYLFALVGFLKVGLVSFDAIGIIFLLHFIAQKPRLEIEYRKLYLLLWLLPFFIFIRAVPKNYQFTLSDEFVSWGANVKELVRENALGGINSATRSIANGSFQGYPPAQELFQYFFLKHTFWSEANVVLAQGILVLTCLLAFASLLSSRNQVIAIFTFFSSIVAYYLFGYALSNILADGFLAVQFAACLALAINNSGTRRFSALLALAISVLILIKPTGFIFAASASLFALSHYWITKRLNRTIGNQEKQTLKSVKIGTSELLIIGIPILVYLSWQAHLSQIKIRPAAAFPSWTTITSTAFQNRWSMTWTSYKENFFGSLHGPDNLAGRSLSTPRIVEQLHISLFSIVTILAITQIGLAVKSRHEAKRAALSQALIMISFAIFYQVFLLFIFMFYMGDYEGVRVAALVRYSGSFLLAWSLLVFVQFLLKISELKFGKILTIIVIPFVFLAAPSALVSDTKGIKPDPTKLSARLDAELMVPATLKVIKPEDQVFYIYQNSTGFEKYIFSYMIFPSRSNWGCASVGAPYSPSDVWTCNVGLSDLLKGYSYLVVGRADSIFWKDNARYLAKGSKPLTRGIYKVSQDQDGHLLLKAP